MSESVVAEHHHHGDAPVTAARALREENFGTVPADAAALEQKQLRQVYVVVTRPEAPKRILCFNVHKRWVYLMDRREFLEAIAGISALVPGLSLLPGSSQQAFAQGVHARAKAAANLRTLSPQQDATVTCIAELLLPQTDTVGATAVGVNRFIDLLLTESMLEAYRDRFLEGLAAINARSQLLYGAPFISVRKEEQESLMRALDVHLPEPHPTPAEAAALAKKPITAEGGFALLKQLAVLAYFTSEPVAKGLIKAPIIPGRYDGCVPV